MKLSILHETAMSRRDLLKRGAAVAASSLLPAPVLRALQTVGVPLPSINTDLLAWKRSGLSPETMMDAVIRLGSDGNVDIDEDRQVMTMTRRGVPVTIPAAAMRGFLMEKMANNPTDYLVSMLGGSYPDGVNEFTGGMDGKLKGAAIQAMGGPKAMLETLMDGEDYWWLTNGGSGPDMLFYYLSDIAHQVPAINNLLPYAKLCQFAESNPVEGLRYLYSKGLISPQTLNKHLKQYRELEQQWAQKDQQLETQEQERAQQERTQALESQPQDDPQPQEPVDQFPDVGGRRELLADNPGVRERSPFDEALKRVLNTLVVQ
jgi:hypothetical protein